MARPPGVALVGADRMRKTLKAAGRDLADLREPYLNASRKVAAAAGPRTPRRTGRLAASIRPGASRAGGVVRAGGAKVPYANPIHWGWPKRGIKAQPWLSQAAQATEPDWIKDFMEELDQAVEQIAGIK